MPFPIALGIVLICIGVIALSFGLYALLRGGRGQRGGIGPLSERGVHVIAGIRMILIGSASLAAGVYALWSYSN